MPRSTPTGAHDAMRSKNQQDVFELIHRHGPISRAEIAARLQLSRAAITNITAELIGRQLIYEARAAEPGGVGRRAILIDVVYDGAAVAGIKLSNSGLTCALTNLNAEVLVTVEQPLSSTEPDVVLNAVEAALSRLREAAAKGGHPTEVAALGISLPGLVDVDGGTVRHSPLLGWTHTPIGSLLEERLGMPVVIENDVNALALGEAWFGHGILHPTFLVVTLGRGVGLGIVIDGALFRGPNGGAGEFGHVPLDPNGPVSSHSARGTVEAFLADDALLADAHRRGAPLPDGSRPEDLVRLAEEGNAPARASLEAAGAMLGRALGIIVNLFAPTLVVLSGEGMRAAPFLIPEAKRVLRDTAFGDLGDQVELVVDAWGDDTWARGAAALAASRHLVEAAARTGGAG
ncbi:MAG: ROK family transcriptional regulator [Trueperaceae bacterium]